MPHSRYDRKIFKAVTGRLLLFFLLKRWFLLIEREVNAAADVKVTLITQIYNKYSNTLTVTKFIRQLN